MKSTTCTDNTDMSDSKQSGKHQGVICSHQAQKSCTPTGPEHRGLSSRRAARWPQEDDSKAPEHLPTPLTEGHAVIMRSPTQGDKINGQQTSLRFTEDEVSNVLRPKIAPSKQFATAQQQHQGVIRNQWPVSCLCCHKQPWPCAWVNHISHILCERQVNVHD